jgi:DNA polymerase bacteriophage-type
VLLHLDYETRSFLGIMSGVAVYANPRCTNVLCGCYSIDDHPVEVWAPWAGREGELWLPNHQLRPEAFAIPKDIKRAVEADCMIVAHNTAFEFAIWHRVLRWPYVPLERWICTAAMAAHMGLPRSLKDAAATMRLVNQKGNDAAMKKMCKPRKPSKKFPNGGWYGDEKLYSELVKYCKEDVETERELYKKAIKLPYTERRIWCMDQRINSNGIPLDLALASKAQKRYAEEKAKVDCQVSVLTQGEVTSIGQQKVLLEWCASQGIYLDDVQAQTLEDLLDENDLPEKVRAVLRLRLEANGSAPTKYNAFLKHCCSDWRARDAHLYYGAHTGRWTSQRIQVQNQKRPTIKKIETFIEPLMRDEEFPEVVFVRKDEKPKLDNIFEILDSLVRSVICAPDGRSLVAVDYAAIEARGSAWIADQLDAVEEFRVYDQQIAAGEKNVVDPYMRMAAVIFKKPAEKIDHGFERGLGKATKLGAIYGMGAEKFVKANKKQGLIIDPVLAVETIKVFRKMNPRIVKFWYMLNDAIRDALTRKKSTVIKNRVCVEPATFNGIPFLKVMLPSGRSLYYPYAKMVDGQFQYYGRLPGESKKYGTVRTWGGGVFENIVQGFCRDLEAQAMLQIEQIEGSKIIMHVHDEPLQECADEDAELVYNETCRIMRAGCAWAKGMPIDVDGWIGKRYRKG